MVSSHAALVRRRVVLAIVAVVAVIAVAAPPAAGQEDSLDTVLGRAAAYAAEFKRQFSGIVAEEQYAQQVRNRMGIEIVLDGRGARPVMHRELRSDILMIRTTERYVEFRDVFEVDGTAVRDRQERLAKLFLSPKDEDGDRILKIGQESARYNIGSVYRNINTPALPLMFLESDHQARFKFRRVGARAATLANDWAQGSAERFTAPAGMWVVEYQEVAKHTVIRQLVGSGDMPARGRFWIEPSTGRVSMTELTVGDPLMQCTIDVSYGYDAVPGMLVPVEMRERYINNRDHVVTTGTATYGRIRRFGVQVDEDILDLPH